MKSHLLLENPPFSHATLCGVAARVKGQLGGQLNDFQLNMHDNGLILQGWVSTYYAKQMAQEAVMQHSGLKIAVNEIEVI